MSFIKNTLLPKNYASELLVFTSGQGVWLEAKDGQKYLDLGAGIAVNALGYGREDLAEIAFEQMKKLIHVSNLYTTEPVQRLAANLVASGPFQAVHFGNSGTEANEAALKYARLYALRTKGAGHHKILCFQNAFHGRTMGALSCTPKAKYQEPFQPLIPGIETGVFNDVADLKKRLNADFAAVIVEPVQAEGGLFTMTSEFALALNELCRQYNILLIIDEVQTGLSRTGSLYAHQQLKLQPDILTLAKPLAGGLPLSATLIPQKVNEQIHAGEHASTFGGGPVTAAVACRVWDTLAEPLFIRQVEEKGKYLSALLEDLANQYSILGKVRGLGLLKGIEVDKKLDVSEIVNKALQKGLLVLSTSDNVLRLAPPLIISKDELEMGVEKLKQVLAAF